MNHNILRIKIKYALIFVAFLISIVVCFIGESLVSYEKLKNEELLKAQTFMQDKIEEIENLLNSDLERIKNFKSFVPDKKTLGQLFDNSAFNFFLKYNPQAYSLYMFLLLDNENHIYSKYGLTKGQFVPMEVIERCYFDIEKFKIFCKSDKLYFVKGYLNSENAPCVLFISQDIKEFIKYPNLKWISLKLHNEDIPFVFSKEEVSNYITLEYTYSWWDFFLSNRLVLLLWYISCAIIGFFVFMINILKLSNIIGKKHKEQYEDLSKKLVSTLHKSEKIQKENIDLKKNLEAQKISKESRANIFKKIFPQADSISTQLQDIQMVLLKNPDPKKIEENLEKMGQHLMHLECASQDVKLSLSRTVQEIILSFSEEFTKNNIRVSLKGRDFLTIGPISRVYYVLYFILKKCFERVPPEGSIIIKLDARSNLSKLVIEDNGFILSEDHLEQMGASFSEAGRYFIKEPQEEEILKMAQSLGWSISGGERRESFNVTEVTIRNSLENEPKNYAGSNIIDFFKPR